MKSFGLARRLIIPIFVTHQGCPHRCVFCNQEMTTDQTRGMPSGTEVEERIVSFLRTVEGRPQRKEVAFYGGTFTALPREDQKALLQWVHPFINRESIDAIRVSTRPDAVDREGLDLLRTFGVETVEVGAQSMVDEILWSCGRGHTHRDVCESVRLVRSMGFEVGIQIMLGLPGEDRDLLLTTVRRVIDLAPDFVRIYPLLVLKGSPLERLYQRGLYTPLSLEEAVRRAKEALEMFDQAQIPVIRMGLQVTPRLGASGTVLAGPYHPAFRSLVESAIFYGMACRLLEEGGNGNRHKVRFHLAPGDRSNFTGQRKGNLARLKNAYGLESIEIVSDPEIPRGRLLLENDRGSLVLSRKDPKGPHRLGDEILKSR